jgi:glycosyltransferase involved in cell wall biosynthesis
MLAGASPPKIAAGCEASYNQHDFGLSQARPDRAGRRPSGECGSMSVPISVVVPTYNRASLIGATLESILDQSCAPAEVIVVDDGSTDETESIVRRFPSMVKYYRIENSGACAARNFGVSRAASPWIAFCDSDDLWTREKLAKQIALHQQGGVEYSFTNFRIVTGGIWKEQTKFDTAPPGFFSDFQPTPEGLIAHRPYYDDLLRFQPIFPSTVLMSKRFFEKVGGFKLELGRNSAEDFEFTLRCLQHWPVGAITEPVVGIRKHESNYSGDNYLNTCGQIEILQLALQSHTLSRRSQELIAEQIIVRSIGAGEGAFERADFKSCTKLLSRVPHAQMGFKARLKFLIASCPRPIASKLHALVSRFSAALRSQGLE